MSVDWKLYCKGQALSRRECNPSAPIVRLERVHSASMIKLVRHTSVWLTLEESQLVSIIGGLGSRLILRKSL